MTESAAACMAALRSIERCVARCESTAFTRLMLDEIKRVQQIAQSDHDKRSDETGEWVEVVLYADALRLKAEHHLSLLMVEQVDGTLHPLLQEITSGWFKAPRVGDRRAA